MLDEVHSAGRVRQINDTVSILIVSKESSLNYFNKSFVKI